LNQLSTLEDFFYFSTTLHPMKQWTPDHNFIHGLITNSLAIATTMLRPTSVFSDKVIGPIISINQ
jgi:hypothetical protein